MALLSVQIFFLFLYSTCRIDLHSTHVKKRVCHLRLNGVMKLRCVPSSPKNEGATLSENRKFSVYISNESPIDIAPIVKLQCFIGIKIVLILSDPFHIKRSADRLHAARVAYFAKTNVDKSSTNARLSSSKLMICCCNFDL
jgi:hypothetical protein